MSEDERISRRYRELAREEPPRHVDQAILSAARRAVGAEKKPARRWYFALATAAVIVLAVAVTVQIERQQPDPKPAPPIELRAQRDAAPVPSSPPAAARREERADIPERASAERRAMEAPPPQAAARARRADEAAPASSSLAKLSASSPEQWLQGIADLRRQGRHDEADRQLAEFRKRYPDYRISEALREKVERSPERSLAR